MRTASMSLIVTLITVFPTVFAAQITPITLPSNSKDFQFPHFVVEVNSDEPTIAFGTGFSGVVTPQISSIYDFDIPPSYKGRTCELVFLLPKAEELPNYGKGFGDDYEFNGKGGLIFKRLKSPANANTTYLNQPESSETVGFIGKLTPGDTYSLSRGVECDAGKKVGYKMEASGAIDLDFAQNFRSSQFGGPLDDFSPDTEVPPIGFFVIAH